MTSPKYSERLQKVWDELGLSDEVLEELADTTRSFARRRPGGLQMAL